MELRNRFADGVPVNWTDSSIRSGNRGQFRDPPASREFEVVAR